MISKEAIYESLAGRHGIEMQQKLAVASVAVCGLGGLGSNIAIMLARAGIGRMVLIDFDRVDLSNVNRQQYLLSQIGMAKTEAMKEILTQINPYTQVICHTERVSEENIDCLIRDEGIICEAFDNAGSKAMLVNYVLENYPDKYVVAASGMAGLTTANNIVTKKITKHFYVCGDAKSDVASAGSLFSTRVTVCAAHQANAVVQLIAGMEPA